MEIRESTSIADRSIIPVSSLGLRFTVVRLRPYFSIGQRLHTAFHSGSNIYFLLISYFQRNRGFSNYSRMRCWGLFWFYSSDFNGGFKQLTWLVQKMNMSLQKTYCMNCLQ